MTVDPLIVDIFAGDLGGNPDITKLVSAGPPWHGLILKASEGRYYSGGEWFKKYWPLTKQLAGSRYGVDFFRGCYHYLRLDDDGARQADYFLSTVYGAGGWDVGDLWPAVDVEAANNPNTITGQQIVDVTSAFAARVELQTGRKPTLYGNSYLAEHGVTDHCGCQLLWVARYTATLPSYVYTRIGWTLDELLAWQYDGDGQSYLAGYPKTCPMGSTDISAVTIAGGGQSALDWIRSHLFAENPRV